MVWNLRVLGLGDGLRLLESGMYGAGSLPMGESEAGGHLYALIPISGSEEGGLRESLLDLVVCMKIEVAHGIVELASSHEATQTDNKIRGYEYERSVTEKYKELLGRPKEKVALQKRVWSTEPSPAENANHVRRPNAIPIPQCSQSVPHSTIVVHHPIFIIACE